MLRICKPSVCLGTHLLSPVSRPRLSLLRSLLRSLFPQENLVLAELADVLGGRLTTSVPVSPGSLVLHIDNIQRFGPRLFWLVTVLTPRLAGFVPVPVAGFSSPILAWQCWLGWKIITSQGALWLSMTRTIVTSMFFPVFLFVTVSFPRHFYEFSLFPSDLLLQLGDDGPLLVSDLVGKLIITKLFLDVVLKNRGICNNSLRVCLCSYSKADEENVIYCLFVRRHSQVSF